jgi:hypothetical protein
MESPFEDERSDDTDEHNWSQDVEGRLEAIQDNSAQQSGVTAESSPFATPSSQGTVPQ